MALCRCTVTEQDSKTDLQRLSVAACTIKQISFWDTLCVLLRREETMKQPTHHGNLGETRYTAPVTHRGCDQVPAPVSTSAWSQKTYALSQTDGSSLRKVSPRQTYCAHTTVYEPHSCPPPPPHTHTHTPPTVVHTTGHQLHPSPLSPLPPRYLSSLHRNGSHPNCLHAPHHLWRKQHRLEIGSLSSGMTMDRLAGCVARRPL